MRRKDKEISDEATMRQILKSTQYVTLAMAKDNEPYLVSLSHAYDEEKNCLYFHCAEEGKKLDILRSNDRIWGQALIDHGYAQGECSHYYATVMFSGRVALIERLEEKWEAVSLMTRKLDDNAEEMIAQRKPESLDNTVVGRIDIEYMTGKKSEEVEI